MPLGSAHLTQPDLERREQQLRSMPGMAHFACTGPRDKTCGHCRFLLDVTDGNGKFKRSRCEKYKELTGKVGERVESLTPSCKYFEPRPRRGK